MTGTCGTMRQNSSVIVRIIIIVIILSMNSKAWTLSLSSCGHGCCDIGCAGSMDVIILQAWMLRQWMCW